MEINDKTIIDKFVKAAKKIEYAAFGEFAGMGHAIWCNYQTKQEKCNCGLNDLMSALEIYNKMKNNGK